MVLMGDGELCFYSGEEAWETATTPKESNEETEKLKSEIEQLKIENVKLLKERERAYY